MSDLLSKLEIHNLHQAIARDRLAQWITRAEAMDDESLKQIFRRYVDQQRNTLGLIDRHRELLLQWIARTTCDAPIRTVNRRVAETIVDDVMKVLDCDFGNIQIFDPVNESLVIVGHRGFDPDFLEAFSVVTAKSGCACGRAIRNATPTFVADVDHDDEFTPYRPVARRAGFAAVASLPFYAADGGLIGVVSGHFRSPQPGDSQAIGAAAAYLRRATNGLIEHDS
jgi:hypothetical protein